MIRLNVGLIGRGGFAREVFSSMNHKPVLLSDTDGSLQTYLHQKIDTKYLLCVGNSTNRQSLFHNLKKLDLSIGDYLDVHLANSVKVLEKETVSFGKGSILCDGSILTCQIKMGIMSIVNLNCTIGHDVEIGDFFTSFPGVHVSGNCKIGNNVMIGSNSVIREKITIGDNIMIGMGSVVTKDLLEPGVYVGNPCRKLNKEFSN